MSETHDEVRALRVMVEELRAQPAPELGWDAIEQKLMARIDREARPRHPVFFGKPPAAGSSFARVFAFAAAAAVAAIGVASAGGSGELRTAASPVLRHVDVALVPMSPALPAEHDLASMAAGDVIEATTEPVTFGMPGVVSWTLAPGSAVRVRTMGKSGVGHTVALERGSIRAEVTPRDPSEGLVESFAVEIEGTRAAVHGTAFSVSRDDAQAIVDVEHGTVAVGPVGNAGLTTGHILVGPARASFSLDGGRTARMLPAAKVAVRVAAALTVQPEMAAAEPEAGGADPLAGATASAPAPAKLGPATRAAAKPAAEVVEAHAAPATPPPGTVLTVGVVRSRLDACFRRTHDVGSSGVQMSVDSTFRLKLNDDGTVLSAQFDPPLKPEFQYCVGGALSGGRFDAKGHLDIPVSFKP